MMQVHRSRAGIDECPLRAASRMTGPRAYYGGVEAQWNILNALVTCFKPCLRQQEHPSESICRADPDIGPCV